MTIRAMRPNTLYARQQHLYALSAWSGETPLLELTEEDLARWQAERSTVVSSSTVKIGTGHAREFYRWALREHLRADDPTVRLPTPKQPRRLPRPMSEVELRRALAGADPELRAILALAAFAGLRACEIAGLDWSDLALDARPPFLRVLSGKGGHPRIVPLADHLAATLLDLPGRAGPVIPRRCGQPGYNTAARISQRAAKYLHELGLGRHETLHSLRHRFGTELYRATRDVFLVGEVMGHRNADTTRGYVAIDASASWAGVSAIGATP